jgi:hypothetical protein
MENLTMLRIAGLGSAAADLTVAVVAVAEHGMDASPHWAILTVTGIAVGLWGFGSALCSFLGEPLPEVVEVEDLTT